MIIDHHGLSRTTTLMMLQFQKQIMLRKEYYNLSILN